MRAICALSVPPYALQRAAPDYGASSKVACTSWACLMMMLASLCSFVPPVNHHSVLEYKEFPCVPSFILWHLGLVAGVLNRQLGHVDLH